MTGTGGIRGDLEARSTAARYRIRRDRDLSFVGFRQGFRPRFGQSRRAEVNLPTFPNPLMKAQQAQVWNPDRHTRGPRMGSEADSAGARGGAVRCKARRTDASSTPGRTIVRNGTDDEDFEDTLELASSKRRGSSGSVVARPELAAVGSVRLSAAEARERLLNGGTGQRTLATKAAFRPSRWIQDLLPAGTGCLVVMPERRSFPQGRDGDQLHALAMNAVFDKEFGCSIQVRAGGSQKAFRSRRRSK